MCYLDDLIRIAGLYNVTFRHLRNHLKLLDYSLPLLTYCWCPDTFFGSIAYQRIDLNLRTLNIQPQ